MAITYSFSDNVTYGTDDINDITRRLTGAGVAPFLSKESYDVSDLNSLTAALVSEGVQLGGCLCTMETADGESIINVNQGIVYFPNGATLEVDTGGHSLTVEANASGVVYAHFNTGLQTADIVFSEVLPTEGYAVPLAELDGDNTIRDAREFAQSKVATLGKNVTKSFVMKRSTSELPDGRYIVQKLSGVDLNKFNYAALVTTSTTDGTEFKYFPEIGKYGAFFDVSRGKKTLGYQEYVSDILLNTNDWFYKTDLGYGDNYFYIEIISGELCIVCEYGSAAGVGRSGAYDCTVCLM